MITLGEPVSFDELEPSGEVSQGGETGVPAAAGGLAQDSGAAGVPAEYLEPSIYQDYKPWFFAGGTVLLGGFLIYLATRSK